MECTGFDELYLLMSPKLISCLMLLSVVIMVLSNNMLASAENVKPVLVEGARFRCVVSCGLPFIPALTLHC